MATIARATSSIRELAHLLPKQNLALDAMYRYEYVLFGGAAGPGKSYLLRWAALHLLIEYFNAGFEGVHVGLFSENYPELADRQISKIKLEFPRALGQLKRTDAEGLHFALRPEYGGGVLALRNLDDPERYLSAEFAGIFVDELTRNKREVFDILRMRKRWPGVTKTVFMGATNPRGIGHGFVKKLWVDHDFSGDDRVLNPEGFAFIRALPRDNPHLSQEYWDTLDSLPAYLRKAYRDGDWSIFEGQAFPTFSRVVHVKRPFPIQREWGRWVGLDWGYDHPMAAHWLARIPRGSRIEIPGEAPFTAARPHTVVYREFVKDHLIAQRQALAIKEMSYGEAIAGVHASPDMWSVRGQSDALCVADEYAAVGVNLTRANNDRIAGVGRIHRALDHELGEPELWILDTCPQLIEWLPNALVDPARPEDVLKQAGDDPGESFRYGLMEADHYNPALVGTPGKWSVGSAQAPARARMPGERR